MKRLVLSIIFFVQPVIIICMEKNNQDCDRNRIKSIFDSKNSLNESMKLLKEEFEKGTSNTAQYSLWKFINKITTTYPQSRSVPPSIDYDQLEDLDKDMFNKIVGYYTQHQINFKQAFEYYTTPAEFANKPIWDSSFPIVFPWKKILSVSNECQMEFVPHNEFQDANARGMKIKTHLWGSAFSGVALWKDISDATNPSYFYRDVWPFATVSLPNSIKTDEEAKTWAKNQETIKFSPDKLLVQNKEVDTSS